MSTSSSQQRQKSILRVRTLRDSLSSCCSSESFTRPYLPQECTGSDSSLSAVHFELPSSSVEFKDVSIREYGVAIGDNPSCSGGVPISLDWEYFEAIKGLSIEHYERIRCEERRHQGQLKIPARVRASILLEDWDFSMTSILKASQEANVERMKRQKTAEKSIKQLNRKIKMRKLIMPLKTAVKKFRRSRGSYGKKNNDQIFTDMEDTESSSVFSVEENEDYLLRN